MSDQVDLAPLLAGDEEEIASDVESEGPDPLARALMEELVRIRKRRKISQVPIAKAIGITQGRVSQMENLKCGNMSIEALILYARAIGADITITPRKPPKKVKRSASDE